MSLSLFLPSAVKRIGKGYDTLRELLEGATTCILLFLVWARTIGGHGAQGGWLSPCFIALHVVALTFAAVPSVLALSLNVLALALEAGTQVQNTLNLLAQVAFDGLSYKSAASKL